MATAQTQAGGDRRPVQRARIAAGLLAVGVVVSLTTAPVGAQAGARSVHQVISANPFGLLLDLFNAEYERQVTTTATLGGGASTWGGSGDDYSNADVFYRYYPSGQPLDGLAFGVKAGVTNTDNRSFFGIGFDANWSRLLGSSDRFYVGVGFGLKRLYGTNDADLKYVPTIRIVNIGVAF